MLPGLVSDEVKVLINLEPEAMQVEKSLRIPSQEAKAIAAEVLKPFQEYQQKLQRYEQVFREAIAQQYPFREDTRQELQHYQEILGLREPDVAPRWRL
jgi:hypothetical protein